VTVPHSLVNRALSPKVANLEKENRLAAAREGFRRQRLEQKILVRHEQVQREYCDRCRTIEIGNKLKEWEDRENKKICSQVKKAKQNEMLVEARTSSEKSFNFSRLRQAAQTRDEKKQADADLNAKREEKIRKKEEERLQRELERTKALKKDNLAARAQRVAQFTDTKILVGGKEVSSSLASILTQNPGAAESESKAAQKQAKIAAKGGAKAGDSDLFVRLNLRV